MSDIDDRIKVMWDNGSTSSEIASELGVTRNTVMGRVSRMKARGDIKFRILNVKEKEPKKVPAISPTKKERILYVLPTYPLRPSARRKPEKIVDEPVQQRVGNVTLMELSYKHCRYIVGANKLRGVLYCGNDKGRGAYCISHATLCYYPIKDFKKDRGL